jgi:hypothetical protein
MCLLRIAPRYQKTLSPLPAHHAETRQLTAAKQLKIAELVELAKATMSEIDTTPIQSAVVHGGLPHPQVEEIRP